VKILGKSHIFTDTHILAPIEVKLFWYRTEKRNRWTVVYLSQQSTGGATKKCNSDWLISEKFTATR